MRPYRRALLKRLCGAEGGAAAGEGVRLEPRRRLHRAQASLIHADVLEENADPNIIDEGLGETALHYACLTYNRDVCELLVGAKGKST